MAKDYITLPRSTAIAKLGGAKGATYYYRPRNGIAVEVEADVERVARAMAGDVRMRMRVDLKSSEHRVVVVETKKLSYGYKISF